MVIKLKSVKKLNDMSSPDLEKELVELKSELFKLRFNGATGGNENKIKVKKHSATACQLPFKDCSTIHTITKNLNTKYTIILMRRSFFTCFFFVSDISYPLLFK